jgi:calreticulin
VVTKTIETDTWQLGSCFLSVHQSGMHVTWFAMFALVASAEVYFEESFSGDWESRWVTGAPPGKEMGKWGVGAGRWFHDETNLGLQTMEDMRHYSISSKMAKPSTSKGKDLVVQFSAKVENHQYAFCGGGYIKLLPAGLDQSTFGGDDEYQIMFGPDLCGCACAQSTKARLNASACAARLN